MQKSITSTAATFVIIQNLTTAFIFCHTRWNKKYTSTNQVIRYGEPSCISAYPEVTPSNVANPYHWLAATTTDADWWLTICDSNCCHRLRKWWSRSTVACPLSLWCVCELFKPLHLAIGAVISINQPFSFTYRRGDRTLSTSSEVAHLVTVTKSTLATG